MSELLFSLLSPTRFSCAILAYNHHTWYRHHTLHLTWISIIWSRATSLWSVVLCGQKCCACFWILSLHFYPFNSIIIIVNIITTFVFSDVSWLKKQAKVWGAKQSCFTSQNETASWSFYTQHPWLPSQRYLSSWRTVSLKPNIWEKSYSVSALNRLFPIKKEQQLY